MEDLPLQVQQAVVDLLVFRASFEIPRDAVQRQLGHLVSTRWPTAPVPTARAKTVGAILRKLVRRQTRLNRMEDIAGCRAVLASVEDVFELRDLIFARWIDVVVHDYVANPRSTGYRAVHVVVKEDGRPVEIQLRTERQNFWADEVEAAAGRLGYQLKDGEGPDELLQYFALGAEVLAVRDSGGEPDEELDRKLAVARDRVRGYYSG